MRRAKSLWHCIVRDIRWSDEHGLPGLMKEEPDPPQRVVGEGDEETGLRGALDPDTVPVYDFSLMTGVRQANAIYLRKTQVDWQARVIRMKLKSKKKGGRNHEIPITPKVEKIIRAEWNNPTEFVFTYVCHRNRVQRYTTATGKQVSIVQKKGERYPFTKSILGNRWNDAKKHAGVTGLTWHGLRRTRITRTIRKTHDPKLAQKLVGHSDLATTMRYNVVTGDDVRAAMLAMEEQEAKVVSLKGKRKAAR
jgi:integrase